VQATNRETSRTWIATGQTDMRTGMQGLSLLVQGSLGRDPLAGDVFVFRGRGGSLIKALWHGLVLHLDHCGVVFARIAFPEKIAGQAVWQPAPDAFPAEVCPPISRPPWHALGLESLKGLVNQS
jgi:transposase